MLGYTVAIACVRTDIDVRCDSTEVAEQGNRQYVRGADSTDVAGILMMITNRRAPHDLCLAVGWPSCTTVLRRRRRTLSHILSKYDGITWSTEALYLSVVSERVTDQLVCRFMSRKRSATYSRKKSDQGPTPVPLLTLLVSGDGREEVALVYT